MADQERDAKTQEGSVGQDSPPEPKSEAPPSAGQQPDLAAELRRIERRLQGQLRGDLAKAGAEARKEAKQVAMDAVREATAGMDLEPDDARRIESALDQRFSSADLMQKASAYDQLQLQSAQQEQLLQSIQRSLDRVNKKFGIELQVTDTRLLPALQGTAEDWDEALVSVATEELGKKTGQAAQRQQEQLRQAAERGEFDAPGLGPAGSTGTNPYEKIDDPDQLLSIGVRNLSERLGSKR